MALNKVSFVRDLRFSDQEAPVSLSSETWGHVRNKVPEHININPLKTKRRLLYLKTQFVPRSKHFISVIKTNQFMI